MITPLEITFMYEAARPRTRAEQLAEDARAAGAVEFAASFIPTAKNALSAAFLPDQGFSPVDGQEWRLALSEAPAIPPHIDVSGERATRRQVSA